MCWISSRLRALAPRRLLPAVVSALMGAPAAWSSDDAPRLAQYGHAVHRAVDGDFTGYPTAIAQTSDGYVWLGTSSGLARFDGARFEARPPAAGETPFRPPVYALLAARDGSLWMGTAHGVDHLKDGRLAHVDFVGRVHGLAEDDQGAVWATRVGLHAGEGPLCRIADGAVRCFGADDGVPLRQALALQRATDGHLWFASSTMVERWAPGAAELHRVEAAGLSDDLNGVEALAPEPGPGGGVLVGFTTAGAGAGLQRLADGRWRAFEAQGLDALSLKVSALLFDRAGTLWIGTAGDGLWRVRGGRAEHLRRVDGLTSDTITALFEDREGDLFVCTTGGLDRLRELRVTSFSSRDGLGEDAVQSVAAGPDGSIWIGNTHEVDRLRDDRVESLHAGAAAGGREFTVVALDRSGALWAGVDDGVARLSGERFARVTMPDGSPVGVVIDIAGAAEGGVWVLALGRPRRLVRIVDGRVVEDASGSGPPPERLLVDRAGDLWLAGAAGLVRRHAGRLDAVLRSGVAGAAVRGMAEDPRGGIVVATQRGLLGWRAGVARTLGVADGLPCDLLYGVVYGARGDLWLHAACGLLRVDAGDVAAWWAGAAGALHPRLIDATDGVEPGGTFFGTAAARSTDGRLWFANGIQLQSVDPSRLRGNPVVPPVHVQALIADHRRVELDGTAVRLATGGVRDLQIDYTAPSFVMPQKVRFRYRLDGHDDGWQDAGARRSAFYTDLAPGHYRFRVIACNDDGLWNEAGAAVELEVPPAFVQTHAFQLLCVLVAALFVVAGIRLRLRRVAARISIRLEERVRERERIARELHDTLLQSTQGLVLTLQGALKRLARDDPARAALEAAVSQADATIAEGRDRIQDLRSGADDERDLAAPLEEFGRRLATQHAVRFDLAVHGEPRALRPTVADELERIAGEAIVNAFRHAGAHRIDVELAFAARRASIVVRDDGRGLPEGAAHRDREGGHWGLRGMHERAERIGARLRVIGVPGAGTTVHVTVPGPLAYPSGGESWASRAWRALRPDSLAATRQA